MAQGFKATADPFVGRLTYFRVVSGSLSGQGHIYNVNRKEEERIGNLLSVQGKDQENLAKVGPEFDGPFEQADPDLAARLAERWPEIVEHNRDVISNPDRIFPDQVLILPT